MFKIFKRKIIILGFIHLMRQKLVKEAGFKKVDIYSAWPHYHFPEQIFKHGYLDGTFVLPSIRRDGKVKFKLLVKRFLKQYYLKYLS